MWKQVTSFGQFKFGIKVILFESKRTVAALIHGIRTYIKTPTEKKQHNASPQSGS